MGLARTDTAPARPGDHARASFAPAVVSGTFRADVFPTWAERCPRAYVGSPRGGRSRRLAARRRQVGARASDSRHRALAGAGGRGRPQRSAGCPTRSPERGAAFARGGALVIACAHDPTDQAGTARVATDVGPDRGGASEKIVRCRATSASRDGWVGQSDSSDRESIAWRRRLPRAVRPRSDAIGQRSVKPRPRNGSGKTVGAPAAMRGRRPRTRGPGAWASS